MFTLCPEVVSDEVKQRAKLLQNAGIREFQDTPDNSKSTKQLYST